MGYMQHHAIMLTGWDRKRVELVRSQALEIFRDVAPVSELILSPINGYISFMIAPDGSKLGWEGSDLGDAARKAMKTWLRKHPECWVDWIEVLYGDDDEHFGALDCSSKEFSDDSLEEGTCE